MTFIYLKGRRLKNSVIAYIIVFSEHGMTNASISSVALPLTATPKWVKMGNKFVIHLCKRTKVKMTDIAYIRLLRVRTDQYKYLKLGFTPDRNPKRGSKRGNKIDMCLFKKAIINPVSYRTLGFPSTE